MNESEQLFAAAVRLSERQPPVAALRAWLLLFLDYLAVKQGMGEALRSIAVGGPELRAASGDRLKAGMAMLVDRAVASGDIRLDIIRSTFYGRWRRPIEGGGQTTGGYCYCLRAEAVRPAGAPQKRDHAIS